MPFIAFADDKTTRRLPAEFEPRAAVYTARPKRAKSWPGCLQDAQKQFQYFIDALADVTTVTLIDEALQIKSADIWLRDIGPVFVEETTKGKDPKIVLHDFGFNNWGALYPGWEPDNRVPHLMAQALERPIVTHDMVLEGGAIECNGDGTMIVTTPCLVDERRNPGKKQPAIEAALKAAFGLDQVIWLSDGLQGDETGGHVDNITRYINTNTVLSNAAPHGHPDHAQCLENKQTLIDHKINVVDLPMPDEPVHFKYPNQADQSDGLTGDQVLTASYANFLVANGVCFLPTFNQPSSDERAAKIVAEASGWDVVRIPSRYLLVGGGNVHCMTKDEPDRPRK